MKRPIFVLLTVFLAVGTFAIDIRRAVFPIAATGFQPRSSRTPFGYLSGFP
jgi:hypothetical protein